MEEKIYNTSSNRFLAVNGARYKDLVQKGYYVDKSGNLSTSSSSSTSTSSSTSSSTTNQSRKPKKEWVLSQSQRERNDRAKSPGQQLFRSKLFNHVVNTLTPNDLLALYIANKE